MKNESGQVNLQNKTVTDKKNSMSVIRVKDQLQQEQLRKKGSGDLIREPRNSKMGNKKSLIKNESNPQRNSKEALEAIKQEAEDRKMKELQ